MKEIVMKSQRRTFMKLSLAMGASISGLSNAQNQSLAPSVMRIVVGFPPGGTVDLVARHLAERMRILMGNTIVVENRPGAAGRLAVEYVKSARPDGSVLLVSPESMFVTYPHVYKKLRYETLSDFTGVGSAVSFTFAFVVSSQIGVNNVAEFVAWTKANSLKANMATPALGGIPHFVGFKAEEALGIKLQTIPFPGVAPALQSLMTGDVACAVVPVGDVVQLHSAGRIKALAVCGSSRAASLAQVPTMSELGYKDVNYRGWHGVFGPAGIPAPIAASLAAAVQGAVSSSEFRAAIAKLELDPYPLAPSAFSTLVKDDLERWGRIVKQSGFSLEE
jgi:tripartite-type tricarboxylate transporter receptor subunit TctC